MRGGAKTKVVGESQKCERLRPAGPAPESSAPPRSSHVTAQLAVASRSAFRPSIGMPPPSKASVIEMCWSSRRLVPFDLRVRHLYGRLPSCIVSWFRSGLPLRPATEMLGAGSVHLARMVFIMENGLWRSENAHFFPAARASYSVRYLSPPPIRPKSRVTPVGRSTGTLYPIEKNRVLHTKKSPEALAGKLLFPNARCRLVYGRARCCAVPFNAQFVPCERLIAFGAFLYKGAVGAEPTYSGTSWTALALEVGKSPTATRWRAELPVV